MNDDQTRRRAGAPVDQTFLAAAVALALAVALAPTAAKAQAPPEDTGDPVTAGDVRLVAPPVIDYAPARAGQITSLESIPPDLWNQTAPGDWFLANDRVFMGFGAVPDADETDPSDPRNHAMYLRGGALLDLTQAPSTPENFQLFKPNTGGENTDRVVIESIETEVRDDGSAVLRTTGYDLSSPFVSVVTEYDLARDAPGALVTTTVTNTDPSEVSAPVALGDAVQWGGMTPFVPGQGWIPGMGRVDQELEFVWGKMHDIWVFISPSEGTARYRQTGRRGYLEHGEPMPLEPGETRIYRRYLLVGDQSPADLYSHVLMQRPDTRTGNLVGRVIERQQTADGGVIEGQAVPNVEIRMTVIDRKDWDEATRRQMVNQPFMIAMTDERGQVNVLLPEGEYLAFAAPSTRLSPRPGVETALRIEDRAVTVKDLAVSPPSELQYRLVDAETGNRMPGKLTFEALRGTAPLDHGWPGNVIAGNVVFSSHGGGVVEIPPGDYRVVASCGPEYHITEQRVRIEPLERAELTLNMRRAFETPGWISADVGVRTSATENSRVDPKVRVVSAAAEGIQWLVTGDAGQATDLAPYVEQLQMTNVIKTSPGFRFTGSTLPFRGDFLLFPTDICSAGPTMDLGALEDASSPAEVIRMMRTLCPEAALLVSRPIWPVNGFLTLYGYDLNAPALYPEEAPLDYDAFQVWEGKRIGSALDGYDAYHAMLRRGGTAALFANTNALGTLESEVGYPRVYIKSSADDVSRIDPAELAENVKDGLVFITNGPFIDLRVNGQEPGSLVTDTDGEVEVELRVWAANWVDVQSIAINLNGRFVRQILLPRADLRDEDAPSLVFPTAGAEDEERLIIRVREDSVLDVVVRGSQQSPLDPVNPFRPNVNDSSMMRGQFALAISAPFFIDADGNGRMDWPDEQMPPRDEDFEDDVPPF